MKVLKIILLVCNSALSLLLVWININLYTTHDPLEKRQDILLQLNFLEDELKHKHLGDRMQRIFPEGFVFTNVLYGLSWCEYGMAETEPRKTRPLYEALYAYKQVHSDKARFIFTPDLQPAYGIYYTGWKNYLLSKILLLDSGFTGSDTLKAAFRNQCDSIAAALKQSKTPYLQSYDHASWPADMCTALASLSNHDRIFEPKYRELISVWIQQVKTRLDPETRLIPHSTDALTGKTTEGARGSSSSLMLRLLAEVDSNFVGEQYQLYKMYFVSKTFGLPSIREYPVGQTGKGDIDSGPVIFGVGFAGTIVSIGSFSVMGQQELAEQQYLTVHAFGMSCKTGNTKKYAFGQLPLADAFIAWGRSSGLNYSGDVNQPGSWRIMFHLYSLLTIALLWLPFYLRPFFSKSKTK